MEPVTPGENRTRFQVFAIGMPIADVVSRLRTGHPALFVHREQQFERAVRYTGLCRRRQRQVEPDAVVRAQGRSIRAHELLSVGVGLRRQIHPMAPIRRDFFRSRIPSIH